LNLYCIATPPIYDLQQLYCGRDGNVKDAKNKLCSALNGKRKITGDEFIALCKALEINPDSIAEMVIGTKERK
jgi:hypothetical protein